MMRGSTRMRREDRLSNLPQDLLNQIVGLLNQFQILQCRAVCVRWRSSIPLSLPSPPLLSLPLPACEECDKNKIIEERPGGYTGADKNHRCRNVSVAVWTLCRLQEKGNPKRSFLCRFVDGKNPSLIQPPKSKREKITLDLLDFRVSEIYKLYKPECSSWDKKLIDKVVINPAGDIMVRYGSRQHDRRRSLFLLKSGNGQWTQVGEQNQYNCDLIAYKEKFYAVDNDGRTIVIDPCSKTWAVGSSTPCPEGSLYYLVESLGRLLLVNRNVLMSPWGRYTETEGIDDFRVFKLDEDERKWVRLRSLGDQALLILHHKPFRSVTTFSVTASNFKGYKDEAIYYHSEGQRLRLCNLQALARSECGAY